MVGRFWQVNVSDERILMSKMANVSDPKKAVEKIPSGTVEMQARKVTVELPMLRCTFAGGGPFQLRSRIDVTLSADEAQAFRDLFDGCIAAGILNPANHKQPDALRYMLRALSGAASSKKE